MRKKKYKFNPLNCPGRPVSFDYELGFRPIMQELYDVRKTHKDLLKGMKVTQ